MDDTFNPASLARTDTAISTISTAKGTPTSSAKQAKAAPSFPRIDFEPLYAELKSLIGENWSVYFDALTRFIRGELSANEFGDLTDNFLLAAPAIEHAHNAIICAIIHNTGRDSPEPGPAAWVTAASDKTGGASLSKTVITSDTGEQRLKAEIMALPARDRRRLKTLTSDKAEEEAAARRNGYEEYYNASRIKAPDTVPASAGGLTKTNWDLEIRKRYTQPLFAETLEFPDAATIHARMVPLCYEESVAAGTSLQCAELVGVASEMYLKNLLNDMFNRVRSNGPQYENGAGGGIFTSKYRRRLQHEEAEFKSGRLQRNREDDLLPTESKEAQSRRPLSITDLKLANKVGPNLWNGMPLIGAHISDSMFDTELDEWYNDQDLQLASDGVVLDADDDMDLDDEDYGWEGTGLTEREALSSLLRDCLASGA